tara:strand:+ start:1792 stop:2697 length:906 start_codon:yes stop_codon:yes gene_type:complete
MDEQGFNFFQNSGYNNNRNKMKTLILDVKDGENLKIGESTEEKSNLNDTSEFNIQLFEPLIIDKESEIYLDHLITYNCNLSQTVETSAFCLKINEFNIQTNVASYDNTDKDTIYNSIVIPNENNNIDNFFGAVTHKGKKFNYVCDINPQTIHNLSGKITNLDGTSAFHGGPDGTIFTYAIMGISDVWNGVDKEKAILKNDKILNLSTTSGFGSGTNLLTGSGHADAGTDDQGIILTTALSNSDMIIFSAKNKNIALTPGVTIYAKIKTDGGSDRNYTFSGTLQLIKENARFIAEFSIISKN